MNIKEEINRNIVRISSEGFESKESKDGLTVTGLALPFKKISRNGFTYTTESIKNTFKTLEGTPVLFNHDPNVILGHVEKAEISSKGLEYRVNLDLEETAIIRKIKRQDLKKVSIQVMYDPDKSFINEETGVTNAHIQEFLELSFVSIPGFADTTAQVVEAFKESKSNVKGDTMSDDKQKAKESAKKVKEQEDDEKKKDEEEKDKQEEQDNEIEPVEDRIANLEKAIAEIREAIDGMAKGDDEEKTAEQEDDEKKKDEEDEKEREEAIRKDKQTVSAESAQAIPEKLTDKDLKQAFSEVMK